MSFKNTIFSQFMQQVNRYEFENQVSKYNGDKGTSIYSCFSLMVIMLFAQIKSKSNLRELESGMNAISSQFYHLNIKNVKRSSLSDALKSRPQEVFEDYYYSLYEKLNRKQKRLYERDLKILDSTTISLCLSLYNWAKFRSSKGGIKIHTMIDYNNNAPEKIIVDTADEHDVKKGKYFIPESGNTIVFDRGYNDFKLWRLISENNAYFVTRIKKNATFRVIYQRDVEEGSGVLSDNIIEITGLKAKEYSDKLRLIRFCDKDCKKVFEFVTNDFSSLASEIADIYKKRWQVELFFKWIKQHLKIKKFYSTDKNGVMIQIWTALITYLLLCLLKDEILIKITLIDLFRKVCDYLDKREDLYDVISEKLPDKNCKKSQLELKLW